MHQILGQNTDDEVFKYTTEEKQHTEGDEGGTSIPQIQSQQTLRETTLEEFLVHAGAVRDNNNDRCSRNLVFVNPGTTYQPRQQQQDQLQSHQPIASIAHDCGYGYGYGCGKQNLFPNGQVNANGIRENFAGNGDQNLQENNISLVPTIAAYPILDGIRKNNGNSSSTSPSPYSFGSTKIVRDQKRYNEIMMEKKLDREKRRKIKNRESAARSRERKEARFRELEDENEKLKKENQELKEKQVKGMINLQGRPDRQLRRTQSDIK